MSEIESKDLHTLESDGKVVWIRARQQPEAPEAAAPDPVGDERLQQLPRDVGWMLFGVGFAGFVAPGIFGLPFMVAGGVILWPQTASRVQSMIGFRPQSPAAKAGMKQISRFLDDLERRFPSPGKP
ncbi:hypothetical protein [Methyloterricola oryzae]|uniref:hypothetical protein n=1 Tax=Methyloterricola oryzae TaxID=1495050 RepID=UPI00069A3F65|nr:hypothetical protein [Methyloterricola oryzae]